MALLTDENVFKLFERLEDASLIGEIARLRDANSDLGRSKRATRPCHRRENPQAQLSKAEPVNRRTKAQQTLHQLPAPTRSLTMEPKIVTHSRFEVIGMQIRTTPMSLEIPALWPRFVDRLPEIEPILEPQVSYGVMEMVPGEVAGLNYLAAVSVPSAARVPEGMLSMAIPAGQYAVFDFPLSDTGSAFGFIFETWLPSSGFSQAASPLFERYNEKFDPADPASRVEAHIPIRPRTGNA
jgi:AraC family transcriptional regulator